MAALAPLVLVYGKGEEARSPAFWRVYKDALSDLPRIAIDRAVKEYERVGKFFPKPAEIRELAMPHADTFRQSAWRAGKACEAEVVRLAPPQEHRPSAEEVAKMMADFNARMSEINARSVLERTKARRRPSPQASVDERGVSPEMRELLARNQAQPW